MATISSKIAYPIVIAGLFIMVSFIALNYNSLSSSFYIIFAFLAIYVFLFGFAIGQSFARPVKKLLKRADDLSKGDLKSRFYSESNDEIGQLSNIFNKIAEKLEESSYENEKTKRSVGIKVEAQTQSLKEIINALEQKVQNRTLEIQKMIESSEKFKEESKAKEMELIALKDQMAELKEKLEKRVPRKRKVSNRSEKSDTPETKDPDEPTEQPEN